MEKKSKVNFKHIDQQEAGRNKDKKCWGMAIDMHVHDKTIEQEGINTSGTK